MCWYSEIQTWQQLKTVIKHNPQSLWNTCQTGSRLAGLSQVLSWFCLRKLGYLVKLSHIVVSHQFNGEACRSWPFLPAWHSESTIRMRPVSSSCPQTDAAHSLRSWEDQIRLPTHISHNLLRQDHPAGRAEMDTAIYNSHPEEKRVDGGVWGQRGERELWVGKESHCCAALQQCDLIDSMPPHQFWLKWNEPLYVWKG